MPRTPHITKVSQILEAGPDGKGNYTKPPPPPQAKNAQNLIISFMRLLHRLHPETPEQIYLSLLELTGYDPAFLEPILNRTILSNTLEIHTANDPALAEQMFKRRTKHALRNAKLTANDVATIKRQLTDRAATQETLAQLYGVSLASISNIWRGKTWKHVEPAPPEDPQVARDRELSILDED